MTETENLSCYVCPKSGQLLSSDALSFLDSFAFLLACPSVNVVT